MIYWLSNSAKPSPYIISPHIAIQQALETGGCATGDLGDRIDGGDTMEEGDTGLTGSTVLKTENGMPHWPVEMLAHLKRLNIVPWLHCLNTCQQK